MKSIVLALFLSGCGSVAELSQCLSPATYVPAYQSCGASLDGLPCVTRIGDQVNEAGAPLGTDCTEEDGGGALSFVVASCVECQ